MTAIGNKLLKSHHRAGADQSEEGSLWRSSLRFQKVNRGVLRRWWAQVAIILVAFVLPLVVAGYFFGTGKIKSVQFSKPNDTDAAMISVSYPASLSTTAVAKLVRQTEAAIATQPEIRSYYYMGQDVGGFTAYIALSEPSDRDTKANEIISDITQKLPKKPGEVYSRADTVAAGPPSADFPIQLQIYENDSTKLEHASREAGKYLKSLPGVTRVSDGYNDGSPAQITVTPNGPAVAAAGLTAQTFGGQLLGIVGSPEVTKLQLASGEVPVESRVTGGSSLVNIEDIRKLTVSTQKGPQTVGSLATVRQSDGTGPIQHFGGNRFATVQAQLADNGEQFKVQAKLNTWAKAHRRELGLRDDAFTSKGTGDEIARSFTQLFLALGVAVFLTYAALVIFFKSFLQPLIITFAVPLTFIGVFPSLYFFGGGQFGFLEILGIITLVGIVENVGIFVIDYANRRVKEGMDHRDAIALATAVRFRPIFLTKVCALGSLLPLAVLSSFWRGLAGVIVAGILTSGIFSLFTTPILYHWVYQISTFRTRWARRKNQSKSNGGPPAPVEPVIASEPQPEPEPIIVRHRRLRL